jgi:hypothetical protein
MTMSLTQHEKLRMEIMVRAFMMNTLTFTYYICLLSGRDRVVWLVGPRGLPDVSFVWLCNVGPRGLYIYRISTKRGSNVSAVIGGTLLVHL